MVYQGQKSVNMKTMSCLSEVLQLDWKVQNWSHKCHRSTAAYNIEHAYDMVLANRHMTNDEVATHLHISHGSVHESPVTALAFIRSVHDGFAYPHSAAQTVEILQKLKF
jgi:hypothetical protein